MKRMLSVVMAVAVIALLGGAAFAQMGGPGWQGMGPGMMGPGPGMTGRGMTGRGMMGGAWGQQDPAVQITEEKAQELAQEYANEYLKGFTVERVLPFKGMQGTMYSVELKGPEGQVRTFHINPWGNVMPFGGPRAG